MLCLVVGSVYWKEDREKRKHYQGLLAEKRAQEKREAWIKELEARDEEERLEREMRQKRREIRRQQAKQREAETKDEDIEVKEKSVEGEEAEKSKRGQGGLLKSSLEDEELRACAVGNFGLSGLAIRLWKWRHDDIKESQPRN